MTNQAMSLEDLKSRLYEMANAQLHSREYQRLYALPLTIDAARVYILQRSHFILNRRACWANVQANAPFDIKAMIWDHEREELVGDAERGMADHYTLGIQEGDAVGLSPIDFEQAPPTAEVLVALYAWLHIARDKPWCEAFAASCILEIANSDAIVTAGNARRMGEKMRDELGIPFHRQQSNAEHMVAEIEHATMLMKAAQIYGGDYPAQQEMLRGAEASLAVDRAYKTALVDAMEEASSAVAA